MVKYDSARERKSAPTPDDFVWIGKEVQNKSGRSLGSAISEDRAFRDFFGTSSIIVCILWNLLADNNLIPGKGDIIHLL